MAVNIRIAFGMGFMVRIEPKTQGSTVYTFLESPDVSTLQCICCLIVDWNYFIGVIGRGRFQDVLNVGVSVYDFWLNKSVGDRTTFSCMLFQVLANVIMGC